MTARKIPGSIHEILLMWELCDKNFKATAEHYGVDESSVRRPLSRYLKSQGIDGDYRKYSKLQIKESDLAQKRGMSWASLGRKYDTNPNSLRRAVVRYRERKARES